MGLDMYAYKVPKQYAKGDFSIEENFFNNMFSDNDVEDFCYWRKQHALHDWFYCLYKDKGGKGGKGDFNCVPVRLTLDDLKALEESIMNGELDTDYCWNGEFVDVWRDHDLDFIAKAREAIKDGYEVYYDSWW